MKLLLQVIDEPLMFAGIVPNGKKPMTNSYCIPKQVMILKESRTILVGSSYILRRKLFVSFKADTISPRREIYGLMEEMLIETMFVTLEANTILFVRKIYSPLEAMFIQTNICCIFSTMKIIR